MDYQVIVSPQAIENLREITAWIARDDASRAETLGNELLDRIAILQQFPLAGSLFSANKRWRKLVMNPYVVVYRVNNTLRKVEVLAFRSSARAPIPPSTETPPLA